MIVEDAAVPGRRGTVTFGTMGIRTGETVGIDEVSLVIVDEGNGVTTAVVEDTLDCTLCAV